MAIGAVILTLPIALLGSIWVMALHGLSVLETLGVYSALGCMTLFTVFIATVVALRDIR